MSYLSSYTHDDTALHFQDANNLHMLYLPVSSCMNYCIQYAVRQKVSCSCMVCHVHICSVMVMYDVFALTAR